MDTVTATFVMFAILMIVSFPNGEPSTLLQGSPPELLVVGAVVGARVISRVGRGNGVFVAAGVRVGASVGGRDVAVGIAAWVCATIVIAAATAVFCTSTGFAVGAAGAPHALMSAARRTTRAKVENRFMRYEYLL
jgi:hypothetical protein